MYIFFKFYKERELCDKKQCVQSVCMTIFKLDSKKAVLQSLNLNRLMFELFFVTGRIKPKSPITMTYLVSNYHNTSVFMYACLLWVACVG